MSISYTHEGENLKKMEILIGVRGRGRGWVTGKVFPVSSVPSFSQSLTALPFVGSSRNSSGNSLILLPNFSNIKRLVSIRKKKLQYRHTY